MTPYKINTKTNIMNTETNPLDCSVVVPMYNESGNVSLLVEQINLAMSTYNYEIILVDDCSTDTTRQEIIDLQDPRVMLIELRKNSGQSAALFAGIDQAEGDYIITMDGDLQNDPSDIPMMIRTLEEKDCDVVTGIRQKRQDNHLRMWMSRKANALIGNATGMEIKDNGCALKVFKKEIAKEIELYGEFHRYIMLVANMNGARIEQVPVKHHARRFGVSKYGLNRTFKVMNDLLLILFRQNFLQKPIYLFGSAGMALFTIGCLINLYLLVIKLMGAEIWGRPLLLLGIMLLLIGAQFFMIGLVLDLQMRTYYESQNKRPYKLRRVRTFHRETKEKKQQA